MGYTLYPGFIRFQYQGATNIRHYGTIGCNPAGINILDGRRLLRLKNNSTWTWHQAIKDYINVIRPLVANAVTFIDAELWTYPAPDADPVFEDYEAINIAGSGGSTNLGPTAMLTASLRGQNGGTGKVVILNTIQPPNNILRPPTYGAAGYKAWADYVTADATWLYLRSNSYPQFVARMISKTNDAVRRKILLDS